MGKTRVTVTIDDSLMDAAREAAAGEVSLSAWVADAIAAKVDAAVKLKAMEDALAEYESEFGSISEEEACAQIEHDRANAVQVRRARVAHAS
ncbi:MAG: hypothetical protein R2722_18120 [Tessaracoccus sp.]